MPDDAQTLEDFLGSIPTPQPPDDQQELRAWAARIERALGDEKFTPNKFTGNIYRPNRWADAALIRQSNEHPEMVMTLRRTVADCDRIRDELEANCANADTELADAMEVLAHRIVVVVDAIAAETLAATQKTGRNGVAQGAGAEPEPIKITPAVKGRGGKAKQGRRGRLPSDESKAKRMAILALLGEQPALQSRPDLLAIEAGVSESTVRRVIKVESAKDRERRKKE